MSSVTPPWVAQRVWPMPSERFEVLGRRGRFHLGHAPGAAHAADAVVAQHGDAGRVVAAVFQPLEAFDQDGDHIAIRDRADDAAHELHSVGEAPV